MIINYIVFISAFWSANGLIKRSWLRSVVFVSVSIVFSYILGSGNWQICLAAVTLGILQYSISWASNYLRDHNQHRLRTENLKQHLLWQSLHLMLIYSILWIFGQAEGLRGLGQQIYLFMFADDLVIEHRLVVPSVLLVGIFLTHTSSEMIRMFLLKYGNPLPMLHQETAAAVEHFSEEFLRKRQNMKQSIVSDMTVEEQVEVSNASPPTTTKESIKVQYHWSNVVDDKSKGKYIGILERILICIFIIYDIYQGLMLLGAMKTLARFKLFENKAFAEYYLIGTLASLIAAIVCGFILKRMLLDALFV